MNINFSIAQEVLDPSGQAHELYDWIKFETTSTQFDEKVKDFTEYKLNHCTNSGFTALHDACLKRNISLIEHIVVIGGKILFLLSCLDFNTYPRKTPLHIACDRDHNRYPPHKLKNSSGEPIDRSYLTAKKLLQLGSPVNLLDKDHVAITPLDIALNVGNLKIAILLLRNGGISCKRDPDIDYELETAKKEIMYQNEKQFKMHYNDLAAQNIINIPKEIINYILLLNVKLELQN